MNKYKVTKIETGFSENSKLEDMQFNSMAQFDIYLIMLYQNDELRLYDSYDKTDVTIYFEDGELYNLRLDCNRGTTLANHILNTMEYYSSGNIPDSYKDNPYKWVMECKPFKDFFAKHAF